MNTFKRIYQQLLLEKNIDSLTLLFQKEITNKDYKLWSNEEKEKVIKHIETRKKETKNLVDKTTTNPQYQSWIYDMLFDKKLIFPEDVEKTENVLKKFDIYKRSTNFPIDKKEIIKYKSFSDLHKTVQEFEPNATPNRVLSYGNNKLIYDKANFKILELLNFNDAYPLLKDTGWCVQKETHFYEMYSPPFYLIIKDDIKYALMHIKSKSLKNVHDNTFEAKDVSQEFCNVIEWIFQNKNYNKPIFDGDFVIFINFFPEELQELAVKQNAYAIQYINNPSEKIQGLAVKQDGLAIYHIKNPSEKIKELAVRENGTAIYYIKNPSEKIQELAVKQNGYAIKFIKNPSEKVQVLAVMQNAYAIRYINNPSEKIQELAVKQNGCAIQYINNPSEKIQELAVRENGTAIYYIKNPSEKIQELAAKQLNNMITQKENVFYKLYNNILLEDFQKDINTIKKMGYNIIDQLKTDNWILFLNKATSPFNNETFYEIGLTANNSGFIRFEDQMKKPTSFDIQTILKARSQIIPQIKEWIKKYEIIFVGSFNYERILIYKKILNKFFETSEINEMPFEEGFPKSWAFKILKTEKQ